jgi:hypothetical protein
MTLSEKILALYPTLTDDDFNRLRGGTIWLNNDGKGDYIAKWEHPTLPRPTDEQLGATE